MPISRLAQVVHTIIESFPVKVTHTPSFGRCLVAKRNIQFDEIILQEQPWISTSVPTPHINMDSIKDQDAWDCVSLVGQVCQKNSNEPLMFHEEPCWMEMDLANADAQEASVRAGESDKIAFEHLSKSLDLGKSWDYDYFVSLWSRILNNDLQMNPITGEVELFLAGSMINHACLPNVCRDPVDFTQLRALSDIKEGEQIFVHYGTDPYESDIECKRNEYCLCHQGDEQIKRDLDQIIMLGYMRQLNHFIFDGDPNGEFIRSAIRMDPSRVKSRFNGEEIPFFRECLRDAYAELRKCNLKDDKQVHRWMRKWKVSLGLLVEDLQRQGHIRTPDKKQAMRK